MKGAEADLWNVECASLYKVCKAVVAAELRGATPSPGPHTGAGEGGRVIFLSKAQL